MKTPTANTLRLTVASVGAGALLAVGLAAGVAAGATETPTDPGTVETDPTVEATLTFAREEERLARDLYATLADRYDGARPFSMITMSEDRHYDAVGTLLDRYGVPDTGAGLAPGEYADPTLQALYDDWLAQGSTSLADAYLVGVSLEKRDIADLEASIAADLPPDVDAVLEQLLRGSERHLEAYEAAAAGETAGTGAGRTEGARPGYGQGHGPGDRQGAGRGAGGAMMGQGAGSGAARVGAAECPYLDTDD